MILNVWLVKELPQSTSGINTLMKNVVAIQRALPIRMRIPSSLSAKSTNTEKVPGSTAQTVENTMMVLVTYKGLKDSTIAISRLVDY
jgi:hypothetical protein